MTKHHLGKGNTLSRSLPEVMTLEGADTCDEDDEWVIVSRREDRQAEESLRLGSPQPGGGFGRENAVRPTYKTFGSAGKGERILKSGTEAVLFAYSGRDPGCMTHFWFGGNFDGLEETRIRYYVDGEALPSIDMCLYLGHGIGFHDNHNTPWVTKYIGKIGRKNGIHNNYRIPFQSSIRVTAARSTPNQDRLEDDQTPQSWWIVRGMTHAKASLGDMELPSLAKLHLVKLENYLAQPLEEFDLCRIPTGPGALFLVVIQAQSKSLAYLEACMRAYDGNEDETATTAAQQDAQPHLLLSSGLEDYFLGTYYFDTGQYYSDICGLTSFDKNQHRFSAYRFHDRDPVFFEDGLRLTCRCGETEHGMSSGPAYLHPKETTYTTYVWYYQW